MTHALVTLINTVAGRETRSPLGTTLHLIHDPQTGTVFCHPSPSSSRSFFRTYRICASYISSMRDWLLINGKHYSLRPIHRNRFSNLSPAGAIVFGWWAYLHLYRSSERDRSLRLPGRPLVRVRYFRPPYRSRCLFTTSTSHFWYLVHIHVVPCFSTLSFSQSTTHFDPILGIIQAFTLNLPLTPF